MNMVDLYPLFMKPVALAGSMGKAFLRVFQEVRKNYFRSIFRAGRGSFFFFSKIWLKPGTDHRS